MKARQRRLLLLGFGLACLAVAGWLTLSAFQQNLVFFFSPSQIHSGEAPVGRHFRVGGMVEPGSVQRGGDGLTVRFIVTDTAQGIPVAYSGILPDLFREGKGVVAQGRLDGSGMFIADQVLAKHDENYMPREAADAIATAGSSYRAPAGASEAKP